MGKLKRKFTDAAKLAAVDDYVSGRKSAAQVAAAHEMAVSQLYRWKVEIEEMAKGSVVSELEAAGHSKESSRALAEMQAERDAYQRTVGEQAVIIELLKKRLMSTNSQQRSELTGLIETLERAAVKKKRGAL